MKLGAFSISLAVKDINVSRAFYEKLGFEKFGGDEKMKYLIMKNGDAIIGLFQDMFEGNVITFNPGWNQEAENLESFDDVREIEKSLDTKGVELIQKVDPEKASGPGHITLIDPDGNSILIDQHR